VEEGEREEEPYVFQTIEKLLDDFERNCTHLLEEEKPNETS